MSHEHTRESLLHLAERSITAERLVVELEKVFITAGGPPEVLRMDNGPELVSQALQRFCDNKVGLFYIPPFEALPGRVLSQGGCDSLRLSRNRGPIGFDCSSTQRAVGAVNYLVGDRFDSA